VFPDPDHRERNRVVGFGDKVGQQQVNRVPLAGPMSAQSISLSDAPLRAHLRAREPSGIHS